MISFLRFDLSKLNLILISTLVLSSCSSIKTETKRSDINDIIFMPHQKTERELAEAGGGSLLGGIFGKSKTSTNARENRLIPRARLPAHRPPARQRDTLHPTR